MITKKEIRENMLLWKNACLDKNVEIIDLKQRLLTSERYSHVNEDMALALARCYEVIGQQTVTIATLVKMKGGE